MFRLNLKKIVLHSTKISVKLTIAYSYWKILPKVLKSV